MSYTNENKPPVSEQKDDRCSGEHNHSHGHSHHSHSHSHGHSHSHDNHGHSHSHEHKENHWLKAGLGILFGIGMLVISIASFNIPMIAIYILAAISTLVTLYLGRNVFLAAWQALRERKWSMATLYTISTLTIVVVSILSFFIPGLPLMAESAPFVLGFWHLGEAIEHSLLDKINTKLDVRDCVDPLVTLKGDPGKEVSIKELVPNDIIIIKKGGVIPVDGVLTQEAQLYTTRIDGSPSLKQFKAGESVKSGMTLAAHTPSLEMRVTKTFDNSYLSLIAQNISKANNEKAPVEILANKILKYFIPGLLAVAVVSGIVIGCVFNPILAIQCVVSVLVSACPCALSLITPMAVKIGMKKAADSGIHFKNGKALQAAADIDTVVFDLNGTLTKGEISVQELHITDEELLMHVALLEAQSDHPVAKVINTYIKNKGTVSCKPLTLTAVDKSHHAGIQGVINGERFLIGTKEMVLKQGITRFDKPYDNPDKGSVYIVRGTTVVGQIALADPLRDDAVATVEQLKLLGKSVHICTGANRSTAEKYAKLLGIPKDNICANTVGAVTEPGEVSKTSYIQELKNKGAKVAMVGDAVNDMAAIASSNIGIAVKSSIGDTIIEQQAGIVVQQGLLFPIATAFDVAKKTRKNIFQNLLVSLTYNSTIILVAAGALIAIGFALNPAIGIALMVLESAIILANLYRLKQQQVVTTPSVNSEDKIGNTTSKILNAFDCIPKPQVTLVKTQDSGRVPSKSSGLFGSPNSTCVPQYEGTVPQVLGL